MESAGFESAPVTQVLVFWTIAASILANITDSKHYFYFHFYPEAAPGVFWTRQFLWRLVAWQTCYANSTEVVFAAMSFYQLRVIERLWGSRKFASFLVVSLCYTLFLTPTITFIIRLLSFGFLDYIPSGPTPLLFAVLAQYYATVPSQYKYNIGLTPQTGDAATLSFTNKSTSYFLPLQLALSQFPASIVPSAVGWAIGFAYRREILPGYTWRLPSWLFGPRHGRDARQVEAMRRRLEGEAGVVASGTESASNVSGGLRRR